MQMHTCNAHMQCTHAMQTHWGQEARANNKEEMGGAKALAEIAHQDRNMTYYVCTNKTIADKFKVGSR